MCQAPLSSTISRILLKFMSIELVMLSKHLILYHPLLLLPSIFPSITVFSNELGLCIRLPKYWSFNFSNSPSNKYSGLISSTPGHSVVKKIHLPMQEMLVPSLGQEDPLEKEMTTHSSILARRIPWMEEPGGLQSTGSQRVGHD